MRWKAEGESPEGSIRPGGAPPPLLPATPPSAAPSADGGDGISAEERENMHRMYSHHVEVQCSWGAYPALVLHLLLRCQADVLRQSHDRTPWVR